MLLLFAISFIGFYACKKDKQEPTYVKDDPNAPLSRASVEHYFYNSLIKKPGSIVKSSNATVSSSDIKNWKHIMFDKSYESESTESSFVEIPVLYNQRPSLIIKEEGDSLDAADVREILNASFDRLIVYKNKSTNAVDQRIVTYIPDKEYLKKHKKDISHNQFDKLDKDFNGYLSFRKWDDTPEFSVRIENGKSVRGFGYEKVPDKKGNATKAICTTVMTEYYTQTCVTVSAEDFSLTSCSTWMQTGYYSVQTCVADGFQSNPCYFNPNLCIYLQQNLPPPPLPYPKDPCLEKAKVSSKAANPVKAASNNDLLNKLNDPNPAISANEYGAENKLTTQSGSYYNNVPTRSYGVPGSFTPNFTWNSTDGYTIGTGHNHPAGMAPSPADVLWMHSMTANAQLNAAGPVGMQTFKDNASITAVTKNGNYVVTVRDWDALKYIYQDNSATEATYQAKAAEYGRANPSSTFVERSEYALLSLFGNSINLYKAPPGSTNYSPLQLSSTSTTTPTVATKTCP